MIQVFINVIFPVLIILLLGFIVGKFFDIQIKTLSTLALYILTPALMFYVIYSYENFFHIVTLKMFLAITLIVIVVIVLVELMARIFKIPKTTKTALMLTLMLSNSGNFGLPINEYAYGEQGFIIASLIMLVYSFYTNTAGIFVAASDKSDRKKALLKTFSVPIFYAMLLGLILNYFKVPIPEQILKPIKTVGMSAIPLNLLILGINLTRINFQEIKKHWAIVGTASVVKLAVIPFFAYFLLKAIGITGMEFKVTLTQIAMPSAVYSSILAAHYEGDAPLTSAIVLVSTLLSLVSLSLVIMLLGGG